MEFAFKSDVFDLYVLRMLKSESNTLLTPRGMKKGKSFCYKCLDVLCMKTFRDGVILH